ncbi:hypothetical protein NU08_2129 [Flavobacterium anhuiense]|uniref:Uncharacterized protein n=1 Tax=Flavobacterium anhuiense TaxID=459526 RepID=A0A444VZE5_9FLAO|nr:hypothetical protein NU08_2129 [Flavobacterium anhuiense]
MGLHLSGIAPVNQDMLAVRGHDQYAVTLSHINEVNLLKRFIPKVFGV